MIGKIKIKIKSKASFTLIEVLLAASIFVVIMVLGITAFSTIVSWKKRTGSVNELQSVARHAIEVMARDIEQADLTEPDTSGNYGFTFETNKLTIINPQNTYEKLQDKILKNGYPLTPSNVEVTSLEFSGFAKTSSNLGSSYQQPYLTIELELKSKQIDPTENTYKTAKFRTTVKPQAFDNLSQAEVQSGTNQAGGTRTITFDKPFSATPNVVISRDLWQYDQEMWKVNTVSKENFTFSGDKSDQSEYNIYWIAVNGSFPGIIRSGFHSNNPSSTLQTVNFPASAFSTAPNVVASRNWFDGGAQMFEVDPAVTSFTYRGDGSNWTTGHDCTNPAGTDGCGAYWLATNNSRFYVTANVSLQSGKSSLRAGECTTIAFPPSVSCIFKDTISFNQAFSSIPNVVGSRDWFDGDSEIFGVQGTSLSGFKYYFEKDSVMDEAGKNIYWIATNGNFNLYWSYK